MLMDSYHAVKRKIEKSFIVKLCRVYSAGSDENLDTLCWWWGKRRRMESTKTKCQCNDIFRNNFATFVLKMSSKMARRLFSIKKLNFYFINLGILVVDFTKAS